MSRSKRARSLHTSSTRPSRASPVCRRVSPATAMRPPTSRTMSDSTCSASPTRTARPRRRCVFGRTRMARVRQPVSARLNSSSSSRCLPQSSSSWHSSYGAAAKLESKEGHRPAPRPPRKATRKEGTMVLVETAGLTKVFGDVRAVDDLTVKIPDGAIGLVGPNGAGKTTFLRLLLSLLQPTAGTAKVLGRDIGDGVPVRERIGYMPEHDCLVPDMTGVGLVSYMGRISGLDRDTAMSRSHDVLQFVGVEEERYRKIAEYSTGMKQKIKLAQSMVHDPQLYIFDEPTTGLDPKGRTEMLDLVGAIARSPGRNVVLSSHLLPDVETICKYIIILDGGHQIAAGELTQLLAGSADRLRIDVRGDSKEFARRLNERGLETEATPTGVHVARKPGVEGVIFEIAKALGAEVRYMGREIRSLEEFFLELVERNEAAVSV